MTREEVGVLEHAQAAVKSGDTERAESELRLAVDQNPSFGEAWLRLGTFALDSGRFELAQDRLSRAIDLSPKDWRGLTLLARALLQLGKSDQGLSFVQRALRERPFEPEILLCAGQCALDAGQFYEAEKHLGYLRRKFASHAPFAHLHTLALLGLGAEERALELAVKGSTIDPSEQTLQQLADLQLRLELNEAAADTARRILEDHRESQPAALALSTALSALGMLEEAEPYWDLAIARSKNPAETRLQKGYGLSLWGRFEAAEVEFRHSIASNPNQGMAYHGIFTGRRASQDDSELIADAYRAIDANPKMDLNELRYLHYGLGKAMESLGDFLRAIQHFDEGNRIVRELFFRNRPFDPRSPAFIEQRHIRVQTKHLEPGPPKEASSSTLPIFVVGMMRSGTSLVEQILSAHSEVGGAGEQSFWGRHANACLGPDEEPFWERIRQSASQFEANLIRIAPGFNRVVDKNPRNLMLAGLIHLAHPRAKIICVQRADADVAVSVWTTLINTDAPFMGDKTGIVKAIGEARGTSTIWRRLLPQGSYLEVCYEDLVCHPETEIRRILEFCELDWQDACLHPEANQRSVRTPSVAQVRQTIHPGSVGRYKRYEPWLGEFRQLVNPP